MSANRIGPKKAFTGAHLSVQRLMAGIPSTRMFGYTVVGTRATFAARTEAAVVANASMLSVVGGARCTSDDSVSIAVITNLDGEVTAVQLYGA